MGIQSIVYALIMEFFVAKKTNNLYVFVGLSCMLGLLSGFSLALMDFTSTIFPIVGCLTGVIVGWKLYFLHDRLNDNLESQTISEQEN